MSTKTSRLPADPLSLTPEQKALQEKRLAPYMVGTPEYCARKAAERNLKAASR